MMNPCNFDDDFDDTKAHVLLEAIRRSGWINLRYPTDQNFPDLSAVTNMTDRAESVLFPGLQVLAEELDANNLELRLTNLRRLSVFGAMDLSLLTRFRFISLDRLRRPANAVLARLANYPGTLLLGLKSVTDKQAEILAKFKCDRLLLPDLTRLSVEAADALSQFPGRIQMKTVYDVPRITRDLYLARLLFVDGKPSTDEIPDPASVAVALTKGIVPENPRYGPPIEPGYRNLAEKLAVDADCMGCTGEDSEVHDWSTLSATELRSAWTEIHAPGPRDGRTPRMRWLARRWDRIAHYIDTVTLDSDDDTGREYLLPAVQEVLARLPAKVFDWIVLATRIVVESQAPDSLTLNFNGRDLPVFGVDSRMGISQGGPDVGLAAAEAEASGPTDIERAGDLIVVSRSALALSQSALVGLIAKEFARCVARAEHRSYDKGLIDDTADAWGFETELRALCDTKAQPSAVMAA